MRTPLVGALNMHDLLRAGVVSVKPARDKYQEAKWQGVPAFASCRLPVNLPSVTRTP
jgi:hypothetical protein